MKTTIELPAPLLEQAKRLAARDSTTLRELIEAGLRRIVKERTARRQPFVMRDARVDGKGLSAEFAKRAREGNELRPARWCNDRVAADLQVRTVVPSELSMLDFASMAYVTMEAKIDHGRITVTEPEKLPVTGRALLTVLDSTPRRPDWPRVMRLLGTARGKLDGLAIQREARSEWNEGESES
jgi:hypothetical protein